MILRSANKQGGEANPSNPQRTAATPTPIPPNASSLSKTTPEFA